MLEDFSIEENPDFQRATFMLDKKFDSVKDMYHFWRMVPTFRVSCPAVERQKPWWQNLPVP